MREQSKGHVTILLNHASEGDSDAKARLFDLVEVELRTIAEKNMRGERVDHTLQRTVLIDDVFLRLVGEDAHIAWHNRQHFYRAAARAMRRILIDHERARRAQRRGGGEQLIAEELDAVGVASPQLDLLALNEALNKLAEVSPRQGDVVELHHFGGYTFEETARILGISKSTAKTDWRIAKAWLFRELSRDPEE